nr:MAG TPA_asm: hypothetical protein [Caudoviricetes sp.]
MVIVSVFTKVPINSIYTSTTPLFLIEIANL